MNHIQIIILVIAAEAIALLIIGMLGKLTRKAFIVIALATALVCGAIGYSQKSTANAQTSLDQKSYLYMAASLLDQDHDKESLSALGLVNDSEVQEYGVIPLRGLAYNVNKAYALSSSYLGSQQDDLSEEILDASEGSEDASPELRKKVIQNTITLLEYSDDEMKALDQQMQDFFLDEAAVTGRKDKSADNDVAAGQSVTESDDADGSGTDYLRKARIQLTERDRKGAFDTMKTAASDGDDSDRIILAEMYANGYDGRTLADSDEAYDSLLTQLTQEQVVAERADAALSESQFSDNATVGDTGGDGVSQEQKDVAEASSRLSLARQDLTNETLSRAIRYLEENAPADAEDNYPYQMEMAYLSYRMTDTDAAEEYLGRIFNQPDIDVTKDMGEQAKRLKDAYLLHSDDAEGSDFDAAWQELMGYLYKGVLLEDDLSDRGFEDFVLTYFRQIIDGISISSVDTSSFPEITAELHVSDEEFTISKDTVTIRDTGEDITDFEVNEKQTDSYSVCYVLDVSGSMSGNKIISAKRALQMSVTSLNESTQVALVSFNHEAAIECPLTESSFLVTGVLAGLKASGGTNIAAGLQMASQVLQNAPGRHIIILLSDGYDQYEDELPAALASCKAIGATIYTIGLQGSDTDYLGKIAASGNGSFVEAGKPSELQKIYTDIQQSMKTDYYITYTVQNQDREHRYLDVKAVNSAKEARISYDKPGSQSSDSSQEKSDQTDTAAGDQNVQKSDLYREIGGTE